MLVILSGALPLLFTLYTTAPFVTYAHLKLPAYAQLSSENLLRYSKNLPKTAELDLTTMSILGRARVTRAPLCELKEIKSTVGVSNIHRCFPAGTPRPPRAWWMRKPVTRFYARDVVERGKPRTLWNEVMETIRNGKLSKEGRSTP
jgi:hypothetical protein